MTKQIKDFGASTKTRKDCQVRSEFEDCANTAVYVVWQNAITSRSICKEHLVATIDHVLEIRSDIFLRSKT